MVDKKQIYTFTTLVGVLLFLGFLLSQTIGLGAGGFEASEILGQFNFYIVGIGFMLGIIALFISQIIIVEGDKKYGDSIAFSSIGRIPSLNIFKNFTTIQLTWLSLILFGVIGFITYSIKQTFTATFVLEQQFTPTASILFSSLLIPISENLGAAFVIAMGLFVLGFVARKYKMDKTSFVIFALTLIPLLVGGFGLANHTLRYQGVDIALMVVFVFWAIGGFITVATGSFIPFWIMHIMNNLFYDARRLFDADSIIVWTIALLFLLAVGYIYVYRGRLLGRRK